MVISVLSSALLSCNESEERDRTLNNKNLEEAELELDAANLAGNVRDFGFAPTDIVLPYITDSSADGNTHVWLYEVSEDGVLEKPLLFVRSWSDKELRCEVYYLNHSAAWKGIRLSEKQVVAAIDRIESELVNVGAKQRYDHFYDGGRIAENDSNPGDPTDPFGNDEEQSETEAIAARNDATLMSIASAIRSYRRSKKVIEQAEEPDAG